MKTSVADSPAPASASPNSEVLPERRSRGWRVLALEVFSIVLGVLLALGNIAREIQTTSRPLC